MAEDGPFKSKFETHRGRFQDDTTAGFSRTEPQQQSVHISAVSGVMLPPARTGVCVRYIQSASFSYSASCCIFHFLKVFEEPDDSTTGEQ